MAVVTLAEAPGTTVSTSEDTTIYRTTTGSGRTQASHRANNIETAVPPASLPKRRCRRLVPEVVLLSFGCVLERACGEVRVGPTLQWVRFEERSSRNTDSWLLLSRKDSLGDACIEPSIQTLEFNAYQLEYISGKPPMKQAGFAGQCMGQ